MDKAGRDHWDASWLSLQPAQPLAADSRELRHRVDRELGSLLERLFAQRLTRGCRLLEAGCARSATLPFFDTRFGFDVVGIDYSEVGCLLAQEGVRRAGSAAKVVCADLFRPPPELLASFDVVFSYGLAEHFTDTAGCVRALSAFLKPGGTVVTIIPNMRGSLGLAQRVLNRKVYDVHVPLDREQLTSAHVAAGLAIRHSAYFLSTNFGVLNLLGVDTTTPLGFAKRLLVAVLARSSLLIWWIERAFGIAFPAVKAFSPYIVCAAVRAGGTQHVPGAPVPG